MNTEVTVKREKIIKLIKTLDEVNIELAQQLCIGQNIDFKGLIKEVFDTDRYEKKNKFYIWELQDDLLYAWNCARICSVEQKNK